MSAFALIAASVPAAAQPNLPSPAPSAVVVRLAPGVAVASLGPGAAPMVPARTAARLRAAAGRAGRTAPDLSRWAMVSAPSRPAAARLAAALRARPGVRAARVATAPGPAPAQQCRILPEGIGPAPLPPGPGDTVPDLSSLQTTRAYLGMANLPAGGDGTGVRVADIEYDWDPAHIELADRDLPQPYRPGSTPAANISHGTAVLSLIGGRADGVGITGLAPAAELLPVGPWVGSIYSPSYAIATAADQLDPGDVLLIEQQSRDRGPADTGDYGAAVAAAIAAATAKGIVVVLPAGNGGRAMSEYGTPGSDTAIVVGGGQVPEGAGVLATRHPSSNSGPRVDVQGPAHAVVTATAGASYYGFLFGGAGDGSRSYTGCFNGTSSASAAVAGAIAAMQGIARAERGTPFTPAEVLARLQATGTRQPDPENGIVGPLPRVDLAADLTPPPLPRLALQPDSLVAAGALTVTWTPPGDNPGGSGPGDDVVLVDGAPVARVAAGQGRAVVGIGRGTRRITVRSHDVVGNASEASVQVQAVDPDTIDGDLLGVPPPPPPGTGNAAIAPAGRVVAARWNARVGRVVVRLRVVVGARVLVARRPVAVGNRGAVVIRLRRPGTRVVVVSAPGFRTVRIPVSVDANGRVTVRRP